MRRLFRPCWVGGVLLLNLTWPGLALALEIIVGLPYGKHPIGHTAVRVSTKDKHKEVIYDFGRYGRIWGYLGLFGEGIMRVWRGKRSIRRYFVKQTSYRNSIGFVIRVTPTEEQKIYRFYEKKLRRARWVKKRYLHQRYRLARDYHGVVNQCTSMALDGLKAVWPRKRWESLLPPRFNKGRGFPKKISRFFFSYQRKHKLNEVVIPLDVLAALRHAYATKHPNILAMRRYPLRRRRR